jgi:hypothetical protein
VCGAGPGRCLTGQEGAHRIDYEKRFSSIFTGIDVDVVLLRGYPLEVERDAYAGGRGRTPERLKLETVSGCHLESFIGV